jgi:hypothetical protein
MFLSKWQVFCLKNKKLAFLFHCFLRLVCALGTIKFDFFLATNKIFELIDLLMCDSSIFSVINECKLRF